MNQHKIRIKNVKIYSGEATEEKDVYRGELLLWTKEFSAFKVEEVKDLIAKAKAPAWTGEAVSLQRFAKDTLAVLLDQFPAICRATFSIEEETSGGEITEELSRHQVYVAFGSNMGDSRALIAEAIDKIRHREGIYQVKSSELLISKAYGPVAQPDFVNGALAFETVLDPEELLVFLHRVEAEADRKRELRWGPRTLDLDIIFYDKSCYESDTLVIPHIDMQNRDFVLKPLMELCPNYRHPILGLTVKQMLHTLEGEEFINK